MGMSTAGFQRAAGGLASVARGMSGNAALGIVDDDIVKVALRLGVGMIAVSRGLAEPDRAVDFCPGRGPGDHGGSHLGEPIVGIEDGPRDGARLAVEMQIDPVRLADLDLDMRGAVGRLASRTGTMTAKIGAALVFRFHLEHAPGSFGEPQ